MTQAVEATAVYSGQSAATTHPIPYPAGINAGDYLLLVGGYNLGAVDLSGSSDLAVASNVAFGANCTHVVMWKKAVGTESGTFTLDMDGNSRHFTGKIFRISGVDGDAAPSIVTATGTSLPNPPNLTGLSAADWLFLASCIRNAAVNDITSINDGTYGNFEQYESGPTAAVQGASAYRQATGETGDDPGNFVDTGVFTWLAATVAIPPGVPPPAGGEVAISHRPNMLAYRKSGRYA